MIHAYLRPDDTLMVFPPSSADDTIGPYQRLAPDLLALPEGEVVWMAESPDGQTLVAVPATFIQALLDGRADDAAQVLHEAMAATKEQTLGLVRRVAGRVRVVEDELAEQEHARQRQEGQPRQ